MMRRVLSLVVIVALTGCCASRRCGRSCPSPSTLGSGPVASAPAAPAPIAAPSLDPDDRRNAALEGAREAWTDEITEGTKALAKCLFDAGHEADPAERERKRAACQEQFEARMKANDASYEQVKAMLAADRGASASPAPHSDDPMRSMAKVERVVRVNEAAWESFTHAKSGLKAFRVVVAEGATLQRLEVFSQNMAGKPIVVQVEPGGGYLELHSDEVMIFPRPKGW